MNFNKSKSTEKYRVVGNYYLHNSINSLIVVYRWVDNTVYMEHLADIKFGNLVANTGWLTVSRISSVVRYTADYKLD